MATDGDGRRRQAPTDVDNFGDERQRSVEAAAAAKAAITVEEKGRRAERRKDPRIRVQI